MVTGRRLRNLSAHLRRIATEERLRSAAVTYGRLDYPRADIHLRLTSREEFHRLKACSKEPWTVRWIERYLAPGNVLYDVGANVGAYSLLAAVTVPGIRVVALEPGPASFAALCENIELNEVGDRVTAVPIALGAVARTALLDRPTDVPGASSGLAEEGSRPGTIAVLVDRLDDLIERFGLPRADHLKLDVDGGELDVLAGADRLLASGSLRSAMVELDRDRGQQVVKCLHDFGLELVERVAVERRPSSLPTYGLFAQR